MSTKTEFGQYRIVSFIFLTLFIYSFGDQIDKPDRKLAFWNRILETY